MPILVACDCGKRFAAKEHLFGRQVCCPTCGNAFTVSTSGRNAIGGILVTCSCGLAFHALESMRGQQARCRGCGKLLLVSGPDPSGLSPIATYPQVDIFSAQLPAEASPADDEIPWPMLKRIGVVGGIVLGLVIVVTTLLQYLTPLLRAS